MKHLYKTKEGEILEAKTNNDKRILEEFDKKYSLEKDYPQGLVDGCKDFLISKLKEQRQEIVEMIDEYATKQGKNEYDNEAEHQYYIGRRDGLWDIINLITKLEE